MVVHREDAAFSDTYGGGGDVIGLDCHLVRPAGSVAEDRTALIFMHPTGGGMYLPIVSGLARAGHHVIWANSRYRGSDSALIMEKVVSDRDPELNLYDPANPNQPPYRADYVTRFREAQVARNRRITDWVLAQLGALRAEGRHNEERAFIVNGTMADPRWLDPAIDPSDRRPGWCYLGDPRIVNDGPVGLARFSTLRSWLSQWSFDHARGDALGAAAGVSVPVLVVGNTADDACTPSHTNRLFEVIPHDRKRIHQIVGATHYYTGPDGRAHLQEAIRTVDEFLADELGH